MESYYLHNEFVLDRIFVILHHSPYNPIFTTMRFVVPRKKKKSIQVNQKSTFPFIVHHSTQHLHIHYDRHVLKHGI